MNPEFLSFIVMTVVLTGVEFVRRWVKVKLAEKQLGLLSSLATVSVQAAEKAGKALDWKGPEKYEYASEALVSAAKRIGLKLKPEEANAFIHAVLKGEDDLYKSGFEDGVANVIFESVRGQDEEGEVPDAA